MITREYVREHWFQQCLHIVTALDPNADVAAYRAHWECTVTDEEIDSIWQILKELETL